MSESDPCWDENPGCPYSIQNCAEENPGCPYLASTHRTLVESLVQSWFGAITPHLDHLEVPQRKELQALPVSQLLAIASMNPNFFEDAKAVDVLLRLAKRRAIALASQS